VAKNLALAALAVVIFGWGFAVWPFGPHPWRTILIVGGIAFGSTLLALRDRAQRI
jgi:hypothetical protein